MDGPRIATAALILAAGFVSDAASQTAGHGTSSNRAALPSISEVLNGRTELVTYRGVRAVKLIPSPEAEGKDEDMMAILDGPEFENGTILIDVAGAPRPGTPPDSRGFIGVKPLRLDDRRPPAVASRTVGAHGIISPRQLRFLHRPSTPVGLPQDPAP
jgi:hypothetical protein